MKNLTYEPLCNCVGVLNNIVNCANDSKVTAILSKEDIRTVKTVQIVMVIGRHYISHGINRPLKNPERIARKWAKVMCLSNDTDHERNVHYVVDRENYREYLRNGMIVLGMYNVRKDKGR